jgi:molybdopterin molybdotransferase
LDDLLSVNEARSRLLEDFEPVEVTSIPLDQAVGRVLAQTVIANVELPSFDYSSMDGFAVLASDVQSADQDHPVSLEVAGDIPAGKTVEVVLKAGQAVRIMTGALIPEGAEAVVPVENTDHNYRDAGVPLPSQVSIFRPAHKGENIRPKGQDVRMGEEVSQPGRKLRPQDIGLLAMLGISRVQVYRLPKIGVFSTGDELTPVDLPLMPGKIHDSNTYTLVSLIEKYGGQAVNIGIVPDRAEAVQASLDKAVSEGVDLILSSAGVSVGAFDFVRRVVEEGGHLKFWRVNMRPGKPLTFGAYRDTPFIGLPGNPVSSFVGFEVFVRPAVLKLAGVLDPGRPAQRVELTEAIDSDGRESYLRAIIWFEGGRWLARLTGHQGSGNLRSLVQANALLLIPSGVKSLPIGAEVDAWFLD